MSNVLVIYCHPNTSSFCSAIADRYIEGLEKSGNTVRKIYLYDLSFEPFIRDYTDRTELEPDIKEAQEAIVWADHITFSYFIWWATPPSILKSFIERTLIPGFAFTYHSITETPWYMRKIITSWDKHLKNKTARLLVTMDSPPWFYRFVSGDPGFIMMKDILEFCGFRDVRKKYFGSIRMSNSKQREKWLNSSFRIGQKECRNT